MDYQSLAIPELKLLSPKIYEDQRGFFYESFQLSEFRKHCGDYSFKQTNRSGSVPGVLRGLHFQHQFPQGKLLSVLVGEIFDVVVDLRRDSKFFGQVVSLYLSAQNRQQLWIPPGFAHGFYVTSDFACIEYSCTEYYVADDQHSIAWNDPDLAICWPEMATPPVLSVKDQNAMSWRTFCDCFT